MASIAKFTALSLTVLVESRRAYGWEAIGHTLDRLKLLTSTVEGDWARCPLARVQDDTDFADDGSREIATATWSILKTLLFTTLMLSQSILSAVVYIPSPQSSSAFSSSSETSSPYGMALDVLHVLSHLSFIMPQFGGVASTSDSGLPELKRAFYMALDVLSASETEADRFVEALCHAEGTAGKGKGLDVPRGLSDARKSFALACAEQLVPVLSEAVIQSRVYPLCLPHLWDPSHRETYESAHSVMLAIFASHAQNSAVRQQQPSGVGSAFAEKIVPMYARCLVENSIDDRLSTVQLCMAYAALVRSASSFGYANAAPSDAHDRGTTQADTMAWFCIELLLDAIRHVGTVPMKATLPYSSTASSSAVATSGSTPTPSEHLHRLHLTLISSVPSVPLTLLPRLLTEVKAIVLSVPLSSRERTVDRRAEEMRRELVEALFKAISQDVGDAEKDFAIEWWYENLQNLVRAETPPRHPIFDGAEATATLVEASNIVSRL
uniref:Carnitine acetyl transferase n=1 Tax=Ganoderma boninense TaxID=34458 RepID=A0A5K1JWE2_9APHY|nr:Carnitine acetyl transferase [Ganoderma boninense]